MNRRNFVVSASSAMSLSSLEACGGSDDSVALDRSDAVLGTSSSKYRPVTPAISLGFDTATPEQMSLRCPATASLPDTAVVIADYRIADSGSSWRTGPILRRVKTATDLAGVLPASLLPKFPADALLGWVVDLAPATTYEVRLRIQIPGETDTQVLGTYTTRALVAAALPPVTKTCTGSTFLTTLAGLRAGDHLRCLPGTGYPGQWIVPNVGTASAPVYISAANLGDVTFTTPATPSASFAVRMMASHVVLENLRFVGPGIDGGADPKAIFMGATGGLSFVPKNWTVRFCEITGYDSGVKCWTAIEGLTVHDCRLVGNNTWDKTYLVPAGETYPRLTWNDPAFRIPGTGNVVFNCDVTGFGDVFSVHSSEGPFFNAANFVYRMRVRRTGDDCFEADESAGNMCFYDSVVSNCGTAISVDGTFGPVGFFRNVIVNYARGPLKLSSSSIHTCVEQNTFVGTNGSAVFRPNGFQTTQAVLQKNLTIRNNVFAYTGTGSVLHFVSIVQDDEWANNAWIDGRFNLPGMGVLNNLDAAKAADPRRFRSDKALPTQPFATAIALATSYETEYLGPIDARLLPGSPALNGGLAIPGVNDGFSGRAPDIGAAVAGRAAAQTGVRGAAAPAPTPTPGVTTAAPVWTPNRDSSGNVLLSDFAQLPLMRVVTIGGASNTLNAVRERGRGYLNQGRSEGWNRMLKAWCGAALNTQLNEIYIQNGGHSDLSAAQTAVYALNATKMQFRLVVESQPVSSALKFSSTVGDGMPLIAGEPWGAGTNLPLTTGWPGTNHTYNQNVWVPPHVAQSKGLPSNTSGWLYIHGNARALLNLDTGAVTKLHWLNHRKPGQFMDCSLGTCVLNGDTILSLRSGNTWDRWSLAGSETTDWATSGYDSNPTVPSFGKLLKSLNAKIKLPRFRTFCVMTERNECVAISPTPVRVNLNALAASSPTALVPDAHFESISFIGDGAADLTDQNFDDGGGNVTNMFNDAGVAYDHSGQCIWLLGNRAGDSLYKITGLSGSIWTITKQPVRALTTCITGTFGRMFLSSIGGTKVLVRVADVNLPIEVIRVG